MGILDKQTEFLNIFPSKYREHIVEFSKMVESSNVDVIIFTARKAVCFFHCLEFLRIWQPGTKIIVSEQAKDHDLAWISGKAVAIVDEVIVTGTNLSNLITLLRTNRVRSVQVFALFINKDWFVDDFLNGVELSGFVPLPSAEAQALGTTIVEAMHTIPRPYSVDYPISSWETLSENQFSRLFDSVDWMIKQTYSDTRSSIDGSSAKIQFFSLIPKFSIDCFADALSLSRTEGLVCKIRLYGRWEESLNRDTKIYHFRIVPYFILPPLSSTTLSKVFDCILQPLSSVDKNVIKASCTNDKARLRVMQYVSASWFGDLWIQQQQIIGINITFTNDAREIHYVFPHAIHQIIMRLCENSRFDQLSSKILKAPTPPNNIQHINQNVTNTFGKLLHPVCRMYTEKELCLRVLAKRLRKQAFADAMFQRLLNRLNEGITVPELASLLPLPHDSAYNAVSEFLDIAIDHGLVVPISVIRPSGEICRAFRHGEETYLLFKDREVFWLMLSSFYNSISETIEKKPDISISPLLKMGLIPRIYIEKILVLFLRYGLHEGIFNQAFTGEGADTGRMKVRVSYDLHGSRLSVGRELPTEMSQENAFVNWLLENNIIQNHRQGGYILGKHKSINDGPDRTKKGKSKQFGIMMSEVVLTLLTNQPKQGPRQTPSKRVNNILVSLSTCETASSTILAIGAEFRRVHKEFARIPLDADFAPQTFLEIVQNSRGSFSHGLTAANSAYLKAKLYLSRESERSINLIDGLLSQNAPMAASVWETASDAFRRVCARGTVRDENHFIINLLGNILSLRFNIHFFEYSILNSCKQNLTASAKKRLTALPRIIDLMIKEINSFLDQLAMNQHALYITASKTFKKNIKFISQRWDTFRLDISEQSQEDIRLQLAMILNHTEKDYIRIDALYNQRGQIAPIRSYESTMFVDFINSTSENEVRNILQRAQNRSHQGGPRLYNKPSISSQQVAGLTYQITIQSKHIRCEVFATGLGASSWLGYLAGEIIKLTPHGLNVPAIGAVLGLNDSYCAVVSSNDGRLSIPQSLKAAWEEQMNTLSSIKSSVLVQAESVSNSKSRENFELMFEEVLKSDYPRKRNTFVMQSQFLGGKMESTAYNLSTSNVSARVVFAFTVQDELSTFLGYLRDRSVATRRQAPSATEKMAWYATVAGENDEFETVAVLNREMGSHDTAALLAELGKTYNPSVMVLIGIAACLNSNDEHLGDVVVPTRVLDAHQTVSCSQGEKNRFFDRPFPQREREMIQGFFVENVTRDKLAPNTFGQVDKLVRMTHIETDAALLRNDSGTERHRQAATSHSDKIDAYDMEAAGVVAYLENTPSAPPTFIVKGLSDLGDPGKSDNEVRFAAARNAVVVALSMTEYVLNI